MGPRISFLSRLSLLPFALALPFSAFAQRHAGTVFRPAVSAPHAVSSPRAVASVPGTMVSRVNANSRPAGAIRNGRPLAPKHGVLIPLPPGVTFAPGLGFDFAHFFAVHPNLRNRSAGFGAGFVPFGSGFFIPSEPIVIEGQPMIVQQPVGYQQAPEEVEPEDGAGTGTPPPATPAPARPAARAPRSSVEYVFVRRDGGVFFAVAFTQREGHLEYITPEGSLRSIAVASLDLEATQRFNEERGVTFRLPV